MNAVCPKNPKHNKFITTAHVMQEWIVDKEGNFIKIAKGGSCLEVTHKPDFDNLWTCQICGTEAIIEE